MSRCQAAPPAKPLFLSPRPPHAPTTAASHTQPGPQNTFHDMSVRSVMAAALMASGLVVVGAFGPQYQLISSNLASMTATTLFAKRKMSMKEKRKKRAKRPQKVTRPSVLDRTPKIDAWEKTVTTNEAVAQMKQKEDSREKQVVARQASDLIETQRKSVDTLTLIKERTVALPYEEVTKAIESKGYFVFDDFLGKPELLDEMEKEAVDMLKSTDKLSRDISDLDSGEFTTLIQGGDQYADIPRSVEFIVSLTRHLPPLLEEQDFFDFSFDATASAGSLRVFDRNARESTLKLLKEDPPPRQFGFANEGDASDPKKLTVIYFLAPSDWDSSCGGGVTFEEGSVTVTPARDRLLIFRSDTCSYRSEPCIGTDSLANSACIVNHLIRKTVDENAKS